MPETNIHIGDYNLQALGSINVQSTGKFVTMDALGPEGSLTMSGQVAASMQSGPAIMTLSNEEGEIGNATMQAGEVGIVKLAVGVPDVGAYVTLEPELITLSVGAIGVGASIKMTPESITFAVGEITYTMTPAGIVEDVFECSRELTEEGHNLTAGETEMNLGLQGESKECPTAEAEVEGGVAVNASLSDDTTDAAKSVEAAIMTVV